MPSVFGYAALFRRKGREEAKVEKKSGRTRQVIVNICGVKNSGKTTLMVHLIRRFRELGYQVAALKHDGHDFNCDVPGTDSFRFDEAGAYGTAVASGSHCFVHRRNTGETVRDLVRFFPEADVVLIEGLKEMPGPKIEVVRDGISREAVSNPDGRFLIVSDLPAEFFREPVLRPDETDRILEEILRHGGA